MSGGPTGGGGPLLAWACILLALGAMLAIWGETAPSLLFLVGAVPLIIVSAWNHRRPPHARPRLLARVSVPVPVIAVGCALGAIGLTGGLWLSLIGGEIAVCGLVGLAREIVLAWRAVGR